MIPEVEFRLDEPEVMRDPGDYYEMLRSKCPVAHADEHGGFWLMSRYRDVYEAFLNVDVFSSASGITIPPMPLPPHEDGTPNEGFHTTIVIEQDDPEHRKFRKPMQAWFTVARMREFEPTVRRIVTECLDKIIDAGQGDLAVTVGEPIPPLVATRFLGLPPEDWPWFRERLNTTLYLVGQGDRVGSGVAFAELKDYVRGHYVERLRNPADDILTEIGRIQIDGEQIFEDDAVSMAFLTLNAGQETTVTGLGALLYFVGRDPQVRDSLIADPSLIERAVEEALRLVPPIPGEGRMILNKVEVDGVALAQGDRAMLLLAAANRDPAEFEAPEEFRIDRARNQHLTFGAGIHRCVGAPLARLEMRVTLEEVLRRMPRLRVEDPEAIRLKYATTHCTFTSLPATWA